MKRLKFKISLLRIAHNWKTAKVLRLRIKPDEIGQVAGIRFYEHPTKGDEVPLLVKKDSGYIYSDHWDVPELRDLI